MTKLAISNIAWRSDENEAVLELLRGYGVDAVEVAPGKLFADPAAVNDHEVIDQRTAFEDKGFRIVAVQALLFGHPELMLFREEEVCRRTIVHLKKMVRLGASLGASVLVFGSPRNRSVGDGDRKQAWSRAVEVFGELGAAATESGVTFCIEPNSTRDGCDFINTVAEAVELVKEVNHPGFGLHIDAGVMTGNEESYTEALSAGVPFAKHFHISEPSLKPIENVAAHKELGKRLRESGYARNISIEMRGPEEGSSLPNIERAVNIALEAYLHA